MDPEDEDDDLFGFDDCDDCPPGTEYNDEHCVEVDDYDDEYWGDEDY